MAMATVTATEGAILGRRGAFALLVAATGVSSAYAANEHFTPSLSIGETLTNNADLSANPRGTEWITDIEPRLQFDGNGARAKWSVDYQRHELVYAHDTWRNDAQNLLDASGTLEAVENWMYVDARGSITQQAISAFGVQAPSNASISNNRAETSTYLLSPYFRGHLGPLADYQVRYNWTVTRSQSDVLSDATTREWIGSLHGQTQLAALQWSIEGGSQRTDYGVGRAIEGDHVRGSLAYQFAPQWRLGLIAGREANDYVTLSKESTGTRGVSVDWVPNETTKISAMKEKRFFGDGHDYSVIHRTPLSAWEYTDSKNATVLPSVASNGILGNIYDLLYLLYASQVPDPVQRGQFVKQYLQAIGIPENTSVIGGFLSSTSYVETARQASVALIGANNTLTFLATQDERQSLSNVGAFLGDFADSSVVVERGFSTSWAHKLSPLSSLTLTVGANSSTGFGGVSQDAHQRRVDVYLLTHLSATTLLGLGARHVNFDGSSSGAYAETALTGVITLRF